MRNEIESNYSQLHQCRIEGTTRNCLDRIYISLFFYGRNAFVVELVSYRVAVDAVPRFTAVKSVR